MDIKPPEVKCGQNFILIFGARLNEISTVAHVSKFPSYS